MSTIVRWRPIREMMEMQNALDRMFEDTWRGARPGFGGEHSLALDVHENDEAFLVVAEIPGLKVDDINVNLHDDALTISAEIAQPEANENTRVLLSERTFGTFSRTIRLPRPVEADNVEAAYDNGLLVLTLPKSAEARPRQIAVKSSKN